MGAEISLLNEIRQSAEMGRDGINNLLKHCTNDELYIVLEKQMAEYQSIFHSADHMLRSAGRDPQPVSPIAKMSSHLTASFKAMADHTPSNIAEMMIQGSTMGVTKMTREIRDYSGKDKKIQQLAEKLLKTEESNLEEMKKFL